ncbi:zf-TFIIB domain-containing protein [Asticcacaulis sp. BYS171W]|uniref:Zf-TFIIB domain-containing protein n=1 Tax=Asticcacaulis aquaticus TaxID=2984212 RepID=A0ABT5HUM4_9CAUL|nr:zf-TFIIB domain-containing protein [Asticcacaulis aquaticus]MDC7683776.1 zf-TFIIB domain-containing protein [Asticcacaulis aquaticus]
MSALQCPVCRNDFREVLKEGILIDVCTQCRGVWLDRGELEKLLSLAAGGTVQRAPEPAQYAPPPQQPRYQQSPQPYPQQPYHQSHQTDKYGRPIEYDKYGRKIEYDKYGNRKKKKGFDMLDIFDFGD